MRTRYDGRRPDMIQALRRAGFQRLFGAASAAAAGTETMDRAVSGVPWPILSALLRHAHERSAFYRARLDEAGWPVLSPAQFATLPPLTRADVVAHATRIAADSRAGGLSRTSGGSSGAAVVIPVDRATYARYTAGTWAGLAWWGIEMPARTLVLLGASPGSTLREAAKRGKDLLLNWLRLPVGDGFEAGVAAVRRRAERFAPSLIYGYPSAVDAVAVEAQRAGWRPRRALRAVLLTGEPIYAFQRRRIERILGAPVIGEYGSGEVGTIAFECPCGNAHVISTNVCVEIGAAGDVLITQLHNRRFPLIRYAIGDRAAWNEIPCPCGRPGPLLRVRGRAGDDLVDADRARHDARPLLDRIFDALPDPLQGRIRIVHRHPGEIAIACADGAAPAGALDVAARTLGGRFAVTAAPPEPWRRSASGKLPYLIRGEGSA